MPTTIDSGGRVVIPKQLRDELGLRAGDQVDLVLADGRVHLSSRPVDMRLEERGEVLSAAPSKAAAYQEFIASLSPWSISAGAVYLTP